MKEWMAVGLGGMAGAVSRTVLSQMVGHNGFPIGTLIVNLSGAFLLCALISAAPFRKPWKAAIQTGFLGAFTTFSALSAELGGMLAGGRWGTAFLYAILSIGGGLVAGIAGMRFGSRGGKP